MPQSHIDLASAFERVLDRSSIVVNSGGRRRSIKIADVLAELDDDKLFDVRHALRLVLAFFAGQGGGLEIGPFRRFCSEPFDEVIRQLEDVVADRLSDIGKSGVDLVSDEPIDNFPDADRVVLRRLLREPDREARQNRQRALKIVGAFLQGLAPSWLWRRP
jgi:hypothetical protein